MTVVPQQSITTSARPAFVRLAAPSAMMRPFSASNDSASPRGAARSPVTRAPMLTTPNVPIAPRARLLVLAQAPIDDGPGACPVVGAEHARVHDRLGGGVEHLVLQLTAAELGADEVPHELQQLHALARAARRASQEFLEIRARLGTGERRLRGRQLLESTAGQLADRAQHVHDQAALQTHAG